MPLPVITDVYRVALIWTIGTGQSAVNVIHIRRVSGTASAVAAQLDATVTAAMWTSVSTTAIVDRIEVTPLDGSTATYTLDTSGAKWSGGSSGDVIPAVAVLIKLQTALRGRRNRGRIFLPATGESAVATGFVLAATVTAMQSAWTSFVATMSAAGYPLVVASYVSATANSVGSAQVESPVGTQRRRQQRLR